MSKPLKTLVIGTSLTTASDDIVRTGVALARATGATPWLVHAYPPLIGTYGAGVDAAWTEEQVRSLGELIHEQARRTGLSELAGFSLDQVLLVLGSAHREIVELARGVQADLILVGAAESTRGLLGSTADRVIRKAACPVFAVRTEAPFPPYRVEIPVDLSPISAHALRRGLDLLVQIGVPHTESEALFVLNPFEIGGSFTFTPEQIQRFAGEELSRFVAGNTHEGARPRSTRVRIGYPQEEILATLAERGADLAVLGTHGRSGFERLMLGSVAAGVLRSARCNLLIVPPDASGRDDAATESREEREGADWSYVSDESPAAAAKAASPEFVGEYWFG
ncbi:MAG TPA: universal stress protein [Thermoanaerobaculia bacterium]